MLSTVTHLTSGCLFATVVWKTRSEEHSLPRRATAAAHCRRRGPGHNLASHRASHTDAVVQVWSSPLQSTMVNPHRSGRAPCSRSIASPGRKLCPGLTPSRRINKGRVLKHPQGERQLSHAAVKTPLSQPPLQAHTPSEPDPLLGDGMEDGSRRTWLPEGFDAYSRCAGVRGCAPET